MKSMLLILLILLIGFLGYLLMTRLDNFFNTSADYKNSLADHYTFPTFQDDSQAATPKRSKK